MFFTISLKAVILINFKKRLDSILSEKGVSLYSLVQNGDPLDATIRKARNRESQPNIATIMAICDKLDISLHEFFTDKGYAVVLTEKEREFLLLCGLLDDTEVNALCELLEDR